MNFGSFGSNADNYFLLSTGWTVGLTDSCFCNDRFYLNYWTLVVCLTIFYFRNHGGNGEPQDDGPPGDPGDSGGGRHREGE